MTLRPLLEHSNFLKSAMHVNSGFPCVAEAFTKYNKMESICFCIHPTEWEALWHMLDLESIEICTMVGDQVCDNV